MNPEVNVRQRAWTDWRGIFCGGVAGVVATSLFAVWPMYQKVQGASIRVLDASTESRVSLDLCTEKLRGATKRINALTDTWTVLYDAADAPAVQLFGGLGKLSLGDKLPPQTAMRWMVPARTPVYLFGAEKGARYVYWNPETQETSDPMEPLPPSMARVEHPQQGIPTVYKLPGTASGE